MTELSNTALIRAIHDHTPPDSTPASVLMDVLNIGREAAYRRMRGEVRFTFGEASALSAHLRFSLDDVTGSSVGGNALFSLAFTEFDASLDLYNGILEQNIRFFREIASDPTAIFASAVNSIPAEYYLKYENLTRFKLFKSLYQHEMGDVSVPTFEELQLSASLRRNALEYVQSVQLVPQSHVIFDGSAFMHWVNAIRAFRAMHLISDQSVALLKEELFELVKDSEKMAGEGEYENGNKVNFYLSEVDLEASYAYISSERYKVAGIALFSLNSMHTFDPMMYEYVKKWVRNQRRFASLISGTGSCPASTTSNASGRFSAGWSSVRRKKRTGRVSQLSPLKLSGLMNNGCVNIRQSFQLLWASLHANEFFIAPFET